MLVIFCSSFLLNLIYYFPLLHLLSLIEIAVYLTIATLLMTFFPLPQVLHMVRNAKTGWPVHHCLPAEEGLPRGCAALRQR